MIPKKLFFTYRTEKTPEKYQHNISLWKKMYPDWELHYYCDKKIFAFFEKHLPEYFPELSKVSVGVMLADIFRYAILYIYGGMYTDIDTIPLKRIPEKWLAFDGVIGYEYQPDKFPTHGLSHYKEETFCQWTLLSRPRIPLYKGVLDLCFEMLRSRDFKCQNSTELLYISGPTMFTRVVKNLSHLSNLHIVDMDVFASDNISLERSENSLLIHQNDGLTGWVPQMNAQNINLFCDDS